MKQCSEEMKKYFQLWMSCANGFKGTLPFVDRLGLCGNMDDYTEDDALYKVMLTELKQLIKERHEDYIYPFGGHDQYVIDARGSMHKNPERLAFVKQFLE